MKYIEKEYLALLLFVGLIAQPLMASASTPQYKAVGMGHIPGMRHQDVERISVYLNRQAAHGWVLDNTAVGVGGGLFIFRKNNSLAETESESANNRSNQHLDTGKKATVLVGPDVSTAGQVAYACALVQRIQNTYGAADSWGDGVGGVGNSAKGTIEAGAVAGLFGTLVAAHQRAGFDGSMANHAADILRGIQKLDMNLVQKGLDGVATGCAKR